MTGRILTVSTLVALAQAKAIITNNCPQPVYLWSVPKGDSSNADNLSLPPGARYEEPWRYGSSDTPGIALKISPDANGIYGSKDEINFAYSVHSSDKSKVWVDLSPIRGSIFDNNVAFYTCHGMSASLMSPTRQCHATDDIELVLCGGARSSSAKDSLSLEKITACYDSNHSTDKQHNQDDDESSDDDDTASSTSTRHCHTPTSGTFSSSHRGLSCLNEPHPSTKTAWSSTSCKSHQQSSKYTSNEPYGHPGKHTVTTTLT